MKWFKRKEQPQLQPFVPEKREKTGIEKMQSLEQEMQAKRASEAYENKVKATKVRITEIESKYGAILQELATLRAELGGYIYPGHLNYGYQQAVAAQMAARGMSNSMGYIGMASGRLLGGFLDWQR